MPRPVDLNETFSLAIDAYICLWGGIVTPKLCYKELNEKLGNFNFLLTLDSTVGEETHLSKEHYFGIIQSEDATKEVGTIACCMIVVFAFESLKNDPKYDSIKSLETITFLRHLRNAAAHGNRFSFINTKSHSKIDPGSVTWRKKTITAELENAKAFPDFISHGDIPYLLEDISKILK